MLIIINKRASHILQNYTDIFFLYQTTLLICCTRARSQKAILFPLTPTPALSYNYIHFLLTSP